MIDDYLYSFTNTYFSNITPPFLSLKTGVPKFGYLYYCETIPHNWLKKAKKKYANYDSNNEVPILLFPYGPLIIGPFGFVITNKFVYYYLFTENNSRRVKGKLRLADINEYSLKKSGSDDVTLCINGFIGELNGTQKVWAEFDIFNDYISKLLQLVQEQ